MLRFVARSVCNFKIDRVGDMHCICRAVGLRRRFFIYLADLKMGYHSGLIPEFPSNSTVVWFTRFVIPKMVFTEIDF